MENIPNALEDMVASELDVEDWVMPGDRVVVADDAVVAGRIGV